MNLQQVVTALKKTFDEEKNHFASRRAIVFWYDHEKAFIESIEEITGEVENVNLIRLDKESQLGVKVRLEIDDLENSYLIYSPNYQPTEIEKDWLYSVRAYSRMFYAEETSLVIEEFGLTSAHWRDFLRMRLAFFRAADRREKLKKLGVSNKLTESELDLRMMAITANADYAETFQILPQIFSEFITDDEEVDLTAIPKKIKKLDEFGLLESFWQLVEKTFGYGNRDIADFLRRLFVTDFAVNVKDNFPKSLQNLLLPKNEASAFLSAWRNHSQNSEAYRIISSKIENELNLADKVSNLSAYDLADAQTFELIEKHILREVRDELLKPAAEIPFERLKSILNSRKLSFWTQTPNSPYSALIKALSSALDLFNLRLEYRNGFSFSNREEIFNAYTEQLYRFDQLYRQFHEQFRLTNTMDLLKPLSESVENCYLNWFLTEISDQWGKFIADDYGKIENWRIFGIPQQKSFFNEQVKPILEKNLQSKVYVIISDAFRYEAVAELETEIKQTSISKKEAVRKKGLEASLKAQLGVLPSYTTLGMASLLPHENLAYSGEGKEVLADGISTSGIKNRQKILAKYDGAAIHLKDLLEMNTETGREFVRPHRVIYIYHDEIDKTGDKAVSEHQTFDAVRAAINEVKKGIDFIVKSLDGSQILVTADHGFLFQQTPLEKFNKSELIYEPNGTLVSKKRYLLGKNLGKSEKAFSGKINTTAGTLDEMEFWIPRGINRFHFTGGARFVHGGAMLQEIVVPVLHVRVRQGKQAEKLSVKPIDVVLLGESNRIVTNIHRFTFLQTEPVGERQPGRKLEIGLFDGEHPISDKAVVNFDSSEKDSDQRKKSIKLNLFSRSFDRKREYLLILRDVNTLIEYKRFPIFIDLAFSSDF